MNKFTTRLVIAGVAVAAIGATATGIAYASIPDSSGVIHACYKTPVPAHGSALNVIDTGAGGSCGGGMTAVTWNQTGPQGPAGATGATGAAGPSTGGASGLDLQIVRASGSTSVTATCPSDHPFLFGGGGFDANGGPTGVSVPDGAPASSEAEDGTGPHGWLFEAANGANDTVVAYAICGK